LITGNTVAIEKNHGPRHLLIHEIINAHRSFTVYFGHRIMMFELLTFKVIVLVSRSVTVIGPDVGFELTC